jgi:phenylalanyl-tRNA synthetase alpha chain
MLKYGIPDLRDMFAADMRWLRHYGFLSLDVPTLAGGVSS